MSESRTRLFGRPGEILVDEAPRIRMPSPPPDPWADDEPFEPSSQIDELPEAPPAGPLRVFVGPPPSQLGRVRDPGETVETFDAITRAPSLAPQRLFDPIVDDAPEPPRERPAVRTGPTLRLEPSLPKGQGIATAAARRRAEARRVEDPRIEEIPLEVFDVPRADLSGPPLAAEDTKPPGRPTDPPRGPPLDEASDIRRGAWSGSQAPPAPVAPERPEASLPPVAPLFAELSDPLPSLQPPRPVPIYTDAAPVRLPAALAAQRRRRMLLVVGFAVVILGTAVAVKLQLGMWRAHRAAVAAAPKTSVTPTVVGQPAAAGPAAGQPVPAPAPTPASPPAPPPVAEATPAPAVEVPPAPVAPATPAQAVVPAPTPAPTSPPPATPPPVAHPVVVTVAPTKTSVPEEVAALPRGMLMVVCDRKATIYVDNVRKGYTSDGRPMEMLAGTHHVKVVAGGASRQMDVRVDADQLRMVEFRFSR